MRVRLPANPATFFVFGAFWVGLAGWMSGGAHRQTEEAVADAKAIAGPKQQADGWVRFTYDDPDGGYDVGYHFRLPTGQVYTGSFPSDRRYEPGTPVRVAYAEADPMVSYALGWDPPDPTPFPIEWLGVGMGALGLVLIGWLGMRHVDAPRAVRLAFFLVAGSAFLVGGALGLRTTREKYTLQVGDEAWTSRSFDAETYVPGPPVRLGREGLWVADRFYGAVPDRAHVWVRGEDVLLDGAPIPPR